MPRKHPVRKAPPKPTEPPCPRCDGAYWRYNGTDWYVCDRVTKRRHVCQSPEAVAERAEQERVREEQAQARRVAARKSARNTLVFYFVTAVVVLAVAVGIGWSWWDSRHVYHGPHGGTAECNDGTISYSQHDQGTCSYHGGVYAWNH